MAFIRRPRPSLKRRLIVSCVFWPYVIVEIVCFILILLVGIKKPQTGLKLINWIEPKLPSSHWSFYYYSGIR